MSALLVALNIILTSSSMKNSSKLLVKPFGMPFLPATICCRMRQKNSRVGAVIPPRMSSPLLNPAKTGIGVIHPVPNSLILAFAVACNHHACMWQG